MPKVTSVEFQQNVGRYLDMATAEPVEVTKHGCRHVVVLSDQEYRRLKRRDRQAMPVWQIPPEVIDEIDEKIVLSAREAARRYRKRVGE